MSIFKKKFRIDFYHIRCENGDFHEFVNKENKRAFFKQPFVQWPHQFVMDAFEETPAYFCGNITKVKMDDIDPKYNVSTYTASSLDLEEDEGIPTGTVFLYLKKQRTLFIQVAKAGISTNQFCEFFEFLTDAGKISLEYVLSEEAFKRLSKYNYISKIDIAIRGLDAADILGDGTNSPKTVLRKLKELNPHNLKIEMSKGFRPSGLSVDAVKDFARQLHSMVTRSADAEGSIKITGRSQDDDEQSTIDLIISRYHQFIEIDVAPNSRLNSDLYTNDKLTAIKELVNPVGRDLSRLFHES